MYALQCCKRHICAWNTLNVVPSIWNEGRRRGSPTDEEKRGGGVGDGKKAKGSYHYVFQNETLPWRNTLLEFFYKIPQAILYWSASPAGHANIPVVCFHTHIYEDSLVLNNMLKVCTSVIKKLLQPTYTHRWLLINHSIKHRVGKSIYNLVEITACYHQFKKYEIVSSHKFTNIASSNFDK